MQLRRTKIDDLAENLVCFAYDGTSGSLFYKHLTKFHPVYGHYLTMAHTFLNIIITTDITTSITMIFVRICIGTQKT